VLRRKPVSVLVVRFGVLTLVVTTPVVKAAFVARCMVTPVVPVVVLFVQLSVTLSKSPALAALPVKPDGGATAMTATTLLQAELPPAFEDMTPVIV